MKKIFNNLEIYLTESKNGKDESIVENTIESTGISTSTSTNTIAFKTGDGTLINVDNNLTHQPIGIKSVAKCVGILKSNVLDFTVIRLDETGTVAAVYTRSLCASDAVIFDRANTKTGDIRLICVISKNANVFTPTSREDLLQIVSALCQEFQVRKKEVLISCTGVIGVSLPVKKVIHGIQNLSTQLKKTNLESSAQAILTTDKREKTVSVQLADGVRICGFAKGAGMIEPDMATMLCYFFTNARIHKEMLDTLLKRAVDRSFNSITIDSDTSTSDTVAIVSTNQKKMTPSSLCDFETALNALCIKLAQSIVREGEGISKIIEVNVHTDTSCNDAKLYAKKIANSPLVKTAIYGSDPNWGRIVMAIGKPTRSFTHKTIEPDQVTIKIMGDIIYDKGNQVEFNLKDLSSKIKKSDSVDLDVNIGNPVYSAKVWGSDLTEEYVRINSEYTT